MSLAFTHSDFLAIADEEVTIGSASYKAVINRTSSRYRDLNSLLGKNETLAEVFINYAGIKIGELLETSNNEVMRVLEIREVIDGAITHCLCSLRNNSILRNNEVIKQ